MSLVSSAAAAAEGTSSYIALTLTQLIYIDQAAISDDDHDPLVKKATVRLMTWGRIKLLQARFRTAKRAIERGKACTIIQRFYRTKVGQAVRDAVVAQGSVSSRLR